MPGFVFGSIRLGFIPVALLSESPVLSSEKAGFATTVDDFIFQRQQAHFLIMIFMLIIRFSFQNFFGIMISMAQFLIVSGIEAGESWFERKKDHWKQPLLDTLTKGKR